MSTRHTITITCDGVNGMHAGLCLRTITVEAETAVKARGEALNAGWSSQGIRDLSGACWVLDRQRLGQ